MDWLCTYCADIMSALRASATRPMRRCAESGVGSTADTTKYSGCYPTYQHRQWRRLEAKVRLIVNVVDPQGPQSGPGGRSKTRASQVGHMVT